MTLRIRSSNIEASTLSNLSQVKISTIVITDSSYNNLDDLAVDTAGGYIKITGTGFVSGCTVVVGTQTASAVSFVSSTEVRAQIPAQSAGTYPIYVVNPDGATAIRVNAVNYSGVPTWTTTSPLPSGEDGGAISIQFEANSATSYSLAVGSTLPAGLTLSNVGLLSGTISGLEVDTTYNFTVVATDAELQDTPRAFSITITSGDPYLNQTSLLLQADVVPFNSDASTNAFAVTVNGDTKPNNFNPYTPGYYSAYFDGTGDYLSLITDPALQMTGDFTWEAWVYPTSVPTSGNYKTLWAQRSSASAFGGPAVVFDSVGALLLFISNSAASAWVISGFNTNLSVSLNQWQHIALVKNGTTLTLYKNGVAGTVTTSSEAVGTSGNTTLMAGAANGAQTVDGYMSNLRVVKGTALYTSNFTPPVEPLTAVAGTSLLACQSNRFIDTSTNNFAITQNGDPRISSFIPFTPSSSYLGRGSGYFDGTGDYLSGNYVSSMELGTTFTIECWVYRNDTSNGIIYGQHDINTGGFAYTSFAISSSTLYFARRAARLGTEVLVSAGTLLVNTWHHIAAVANAGSLQLYLDGVAVGSPLTITAMTTIPATYGIGARSNGFDVSTTDFFGYISNLRIVSTALYTSNFTPPTSPLTAVAGTSLLTLQTNQPNTNGVFLDSSTNNFVITRAGDAAQSSFSPYGANWSNYFDGNGDYLDIINSSTCANFGTSDFTIEGWFYFNSLSTSILADFRSSPSDVAGSLYNNGSSVAWYVSGADRIIGGTLVINTWNHIAVCRASGSTRLFLNGTQVGSTYSDSNNYVGNTNRPRLGFLGDGTGSLPYTGYMSNLRILKGTALYTSTFTPPTAPLAAIANTSLLTCADNRFVDDSANNFVITRNGDVRVERFGPLPATTVTPRYSAYFDGTGDYLQAGTNSNLALGSGDFTIEGWHYCTGYNGGATIYSTINTYPSSTGLLFYIETGGRYTIDVNGTILQPVGAAALNAWVHWAVVRNGSTLSIYINGTSIGSVSSSTNFTDQYAVIGRTGAGSNSNLFLGYLSNIRIVKGTAVYTSNFTPPTSPLTAIANTSLLTCQSTTIIDNSTNNFTLTAAGDVRPTTFAPFDPVYTSKQSYTPATYGGSGYFDGTGDRLSISSPTPGLSLSTGDFTIEMWVYKTVAINACLLDARSAATASPWFLGIDASNFPYFYDGSTYTSSLAITLNSWNHVSVVKTSGVLKIFVNGTQGYSASYNVNLDRTAGLTIGDSVTSAAPFLGYISNIRIVKGTAVYTANFTPLVAPLASITNTSLLVNFTDASAADNTGAHIVRHVGNAQTSTVVKKYGTGSMYFDGSGDYLSIPNHPAFLFGSGDYTIEAWIYPTALTGYPCIAGIWSTVTPGKQAWMLFIDFNGSMAFYIDPADTLILSAPSGTIQTNVWQHVAVTKSGTAFKMFKDGVVVASATQSHTMQAGTGALEIGDVSDGGTHDYTGYIDDLRITKGYARYTANFTPPSRLQSK